MGDVITIGVDLAKSVFQVHGVDAATQLACGSGRGRPRSSGRAPWPR